MLKESRINNSKAKPILLTLRRPLASISILGLNYYENSPEKGKEKHISETIIK